MAARTQLLAPRRQHLRAFDGRSGTGSRAAPPPPRVPRAVAPLALLLMAASALALAPLMGEAYAQSSITVSSTYDDTYGPHTITDPGTIVAIEVDFGKAVFVDGDSLTLELATGGTSNGTAMYVSGNSTSTLVFEYEVMDGDKTDDLDYTSSSALGLGGASIQYGNDTAVGTALPMPGTVGSLGTSESIMIDTTLLFPPPPTSLLPGMGVVYSVYGGVTQPYTRPSILDAAHGIDSFTLRNGSTYVIVSSYNNNSVSLYHVREDATLEWKDTAYNGTDNFVALSGPERIDAFTLRNGDTYAMAASFGGDAAQLIRVHENATLEAGGAAFDSTAARASNYLALDGATGVEAFALRNGDTYVLVASRDDDGVQLIRVDDEGNMAAAGSRTMNDGADSTALSNSWAVAAFDLRNGSTYALVGGQYASARASLPDLQQLGVDEDGINVVRSKGDGDSGLEHLSGVRDLAPFTMRNGSTYVLAASYEDDGVQLIRVHEDGDFTGAGYATNGSGDFERLAKPLGVDTFAIDGDMYGIVTSHGVMTGPIIAQVSDDAVQLIRVHENGTLKEAGTFKHGRTFCPLASATSNILDDFCGPWAVTAFTLSDGAPYAAVALSNSDRISLIKLSLPQATVQYITSPDDNGTYTSTINATVVFDGRVYVNASDPPKLQMNTGRSAEYLSGTGTTALTFRYDVGSNPDTTLDHNSRTALTGTITDYLGAEADLMLPANGSGNTLGERKMLVANGTDTAVMSVSFEGEDDAYGRNDTVSIAVEFNRQVNVSGVATLLLGTNTTANKTADYASGNGSKKLVFDYTVASGDKTGNLDYAGRGALVVNNGSVVDMFGNNASLTLPDKGSGGTLGESKAVRIDGDRPFVRSVSSDTAGGMYGTGTVIDVRVTFNEDVVVDGFPSVPLETGDVDRSAIYVSGTGTTTLTFNYTVQAGDATGDLNHMAAIDLNGGGISDRVNPAILGLPGADSVNSLGGSKDIAINTTMPSGQNGGAGDGTDNGGSGTGNGTVTPPPTNGTVTPPPTNGTAMPPTDRTCSLSLAMPNMTLEASLGRQSAEAARQVVNNTGSLPFDRVELAATPWYIDPASDMPESGPSLPADRTVVSTTGSNGTFVALSDDYALQGITAGMGAQLWFKIDLSEDRGVDAEELVQRITYTAECRSSSGS